MGPEDEFLECIRRIEEWPVLEGGDRTAAASRAAKVLIENDDIHTTLKYLFLEAPMSGMMRAITIGVVNHFHGEIQCYCQRKKLPKSG